MILDQYIYYDIEPFSPGMKVADALKKMQAHNLDIMPVVESEKLCNYAYIDALNLMDKTKKLKDLPLFSPILPFMSLNEHLLTALTHLKTLNLSLLAVLDHNGLYQGILKTKDVVFAISQSISVKNSGSIIVIRVKPIDYSLSDISRIIEYSDAKVLGFLVFEVENSNELDIHLKLNTTALKHILATLERYDYKVMQYFNREDLTDDLDQRYANLMKFIDV